MGAELNVLEKIRIARDSDDEFPEEREVEFDPDLRDEYDDVNPGDRDPSPGEAPTKATGSGRGPRTVRAVREAPRVTKKMRDDAAEELSSFLEAIALVWGLQAPPCGETLEEIAPDVAEKAVKLLARNPKWLMRVREGGFLGDAVKLALAFKPLASVTWDYYSQPQGGDDDAVEFDPSKFAAYDGSGIRR